MPRLGIRLYLDENVDLHLAEALQPHGHDAVHALLERNVKIPDNEHLRYATSQGRAIVTHNFDDYSRLHVDFAQRGESHEGIILVPVRPLSELLRRLRRHLDIYTPVEQQNALLWA